MNRKKDKKYFLFLISLIVLTFPLFINSFALLILINNSGNEPLIKYAIEMVNVVSSLLPSLTDLESNFLRNRLEKFLFSSICFL